jgi:signal transduction histidine kinase
MPPDPDLLRVALEAITVAARHPGARNLWVDVAREAEQRVRVEDDGTGPVARHETSWGFRALSDLAADCGVELKVTARVGGVTVIQIGGSMPDAVAG